MSDIPTAGIGSETKPVFFSGTTGRPVACTYSLNANVPANAIFTDEKVKQSPVTTDGSFEVLFAGSTGNTAKTEGVGKTTTLTFNPSTGALSATSFTGNGSGLTTLNASNISSGTLAVDRLPGSAVTIGTYGPAAGGTLSHSGTFDVPDFTVDAKGRITGAHTRTFTLPAQYTHPTHTSKTSGLYKITVDSLGHVSGTAAVTKSDIPALDYISSTTTRNPNVVLAGPASGTTAAAPTFRALVAADLPSSGATAGSYGPSANATPGYGSTFNVPYITVDSKGRVTAISTKTVKIPASDNTNTTYTFATGDNNGTFKVTPSGGSATNISIKGLGSAAYTASSAYATAGHTHTYIESKGTYKFDSSTLPNSFDYGISTGFVNSDSGFGSYGTVLTVRSYTGGGGTLQLYAPYSETYGGTHMKARFGNYAVSDGNSWTALKEIAWVSDIPSSIKNPNALTVKGNGTASFTYDGSAAKTLNIKPGTGISVSSDTSGNITITNTSTNTDTKNTAGSTNTSSKIFLIGATSQAANPQTYSHDTAYVGTDGCLYSNNTKVSVEGHTHGYLPLAGGNMTGDITFDASHGIVQHQRSDSNYTSAITWLKGGTSQATYDPQIGQHNTGDTNGSITILPYPTDTSPWSSSVGLYISKTRLLFNGTSISLSGHTHNYAGSSSAGGVANSAAKLATARTINGVKFDGTADIIVPRSIKHIHYANGTNGTSGYVKICTVGTNAAYGDQPIRITIGQRRISVYDIFITFENSGSAKATIRDAYFRSNRLAKQSPEVHYYLNSNGYYDIYVKKTESQDHIFIMDYLKSDRDEGDHVELTWTNTLVSTLPSGSVKMLNEMDKYYLSTISRAANTVLAAPNGSAGSATFRALVAADLPASGATAGSYGPSANTSPAHSGTFSVPYITVDAKGRVTAISTKTITLPASGNTDTKNTAGSTNTSSKIFLIGATSQAANPQTYSHDTAYVGTDGCLYSNNTKVSVEGHTHGYLPLAGGTMTGDITFAGVSSTTYPALSNQIYFSGSTDWARILYEVTASDAGQLVFETGDDANAKIVFRNKVTSGSTYTRQVTIADGVISGNGSGLTSLNASNISSGTLSADRLATSGATAGSYGPSANATPGYGSTFNVPYITVDAKGRVTAISTKTVKIPASDNTNTTYTFATGDNNGTFKVTPSGGTATNISIKGLGSAAYTNSSAYATSGHTHGLGHSNFTVAIDSTTNTWAAIGVDGTNKYVLKSIRTNTNAPPYLLNDFSAGIVFGGEDTRGVISMKYNTPSIRFAGGNRTAADGGTAVWYITLTGTHNTTYNLDTMHQVTQTATTTSAAYEVLFSGTADNTTRTEGARKNSNLTFNPSTGVLTTDRLYSARNTGTYLAGNKGSAIINSTASAGAYVMLARMHSTNGYFTHGTYQNSYLLQYTVQSTIDAGTNAVTKSVTLLNESGNSSFPGTVTAAAFNGKINGKSYSEFDPTSTSTNRHCLLFYQDKMETSSGKVGADLLLDYDTIQGVLNSPGMHCGVLDALSIYISGTGDDSGIHYKGTKASYNMIKFVDNTVDTYGNGIVIGGGGLVVMGAGESADNLVSALSLTGGQEKLYLGSDSEIYFYINCNTIGDRKGITLNTSLSFYPNSNNTGTVGTSSNKWNAMYATTFYGAFSGSGASLTSLNASNISSGTLSADRLATSGVKAGSYGPSANASPAHSGTFNVPYITVDNKGRVMAIATKTITLPASGNTDANVKQSATSTANFRGVILGTNNTVNTGDTRETTVTGQGYITNKIFAQPSTGNLYASNIYAYVNGTDEVRITLYRSGNSSWRFVNNGGTLSLQNNYYNSAVQSWYNVAQFNSGGTNAIKLMTPPQLTGTNRSTTYGYSTIDMAICSKNSWAMSMRWLNNARDTTRGEFGAYGTADKLTYYYWGTEYRATKLRLYPGTGGGLVSQQSNGFRIAANGYGVIFRVDSDNFYILLTDKKTDGSELTGDNWNSKRPLQIGLSSGVCNINGTAATAKKLKYCTLCNEASDAASYPWYRMAYAYTTNAYSDLNLVMMVTCGYSSKWGIFKARARTEGTAGTFGGTVTIDWIVNHGFTNAQLYLLVKNNYQVDTAKSGTGTAEIWFKSDGRYYGYTFTVLHEGRRDGTSSDLWALSSYRVNGSESYNKNASGIKAATSKSLKTATTTSNTGWTNNAIDDNIIPTMSFMAYWNGRYNSSNSNLQYCDRGRFGTIITAGSGDYVKKSKVLWTGTVATASRGEKSYTLANKATGYNIIKILYTSTTMTGGAAGCLEINGTKTNVSQPVVVGATATTTMIFYFKISSNGSTITVGSGNDVITITGIYGLII